MPKVNLVFTVTNASNFAPISSGTTFTYTPSAVSKATHGDPSNAVTLSGTPPNQTIGLNARGDVNLAFTLASGPNNTDVYLPVGLGLKVDGGGSVPATVFGAFPSWTISGPNSQKPDSPSTPTLALDDADPGSATFDFVMVIQRTRDGALGMIDPRIVNV